ncbi:MaoC family dehydratase [Halosegnis marinus]
MGYRQRDWSFERSVESREDIAVGDTVTFSKRLTGDDVRAFARASGDTNRLHLDRAFAERTRFGERIVHGTLVSGLVSAALARLPGLTVYLSQEVSYLAAVPVGERVSATCEVVEALGDDRYRLATTVADGDGETVVDGEALVLIDPLPER